MPKCESLVEIQQFRHECSSIMYETTQKKHNKFISVALFSDIGQCFGPAQTKGLENQKSCHVRMISYKIQHF